MAVQLTAQLQASPKAIKMTMSRIQKSTPESRSHWASKRFNEITGGLSKSINNTSVAAEKFSPATQQTVSQDQPKLKAAATNTRDAIRLCTAPSESSRTENTGAVRTQNTASITKETPTISTLERLNVTVIGVNQTDNTSTELPFTAEEFQSNISTDIDTAVKDGTIDQITADVVQTPVVLESLSEKLLNGLETVVETVDAVCEAVDTVRDAVDTASAIVDNGLIGTLTDTLTDTLTSSVTDFVADHRETIIDTFRPITPELSPNDIATLTKDIDPLVEVVKSAVQPAIDTVKATVEAKVQALQVMMEETTRSVGETTRNVEETAQNVEDAKEQIEKAKTTIETMKDVVGAFSLVKGLYMVAKSIGQVTAIRKNLATKHPGKKLTDVFTPNIFQPPGKQMSLGDKWDVMRTVVQPLRTLGEGVTDITIGVGILAGVGIGATLAFTILPFAGIASGISSALDSNKSLTERAQFSEIENAIDRQIQFESVPGNEGKPMPPLSNFDTLKIMIRTSGSVSSITEEAARLLAKEAPPPEGTTGVQKSPKEQKADSAARAKKFVSLKKQILARHAAADVVRSGTKFTASFAFAGLAFLNPIAAICTAIAIGGSGAYAAHKLDSAANEIEKEMFIEFPEEEPPELPSKPVNILDYYLPKKKEEPAADSVS